MTPEEITKLAEEYAEEVTKDMAKPLDEPSCLLNETKRATKEYIADFMQWLLRTHCIVSKEKVREMHTALSKEMSMLGNWEEREIFKARISMLNYLFGKDLFNDNDRT